MRRYGNRKRSSEEKKAAAQQLLTYRRTLDGLSCDDLARSYGLSVPDAQALLEGEKLRRSAWR